LLRSPQRQQVKKRASRRASFFAQLPLGLGWPGGIQIAGPRRETMRRSRATTSPNGTLAEAATAGRASVDQSSTRGLSSQCSEYRVKRPEMSSGEWPERTNATVSRCSGRWQCEQRYAPARIDTEYLGTLTSAG